MLDPNNKLFRWGPISSCPLFMGFTIFSSFSLQRQQFNSSYSESVIFFKDKKVTWYLDSKDFSDHCNKCLEINVLDKESEINYLHEWNKRTQKLTQTFSNLESLDLNTLDKEELTKRFAEYSRVYLDWFTHSMTIGLINIALDPLVSTKLKPFFMTDKEYNHGLSILTSPTSLTFYRREQRDMILIIKDNPANTDQAIEKHRKTYHWVLNSYYQAKKLSHDYFKKEFIKLKKDNWKEQLRDIDSYAENISKEKKQLINSKKISPDIVDLINLSDTYSILQDDRKMYNFMGDHFLELFISAFSIHLNKSPEDLRYYFSDELSSGELLSESELNRRQEAFALSIGEGFEKRYSGESAKRLYNTFEEPKSIQTTMLHGRLASSGSQIYFRGPAKIILNIEQIDKIEEGDILVATMTSPDFILGMKKAGAVITDAGGILSHAAIVSRELGIPCIVGTEVATKVIKDGDIIELHCGRGTVRIIKST